MNMFRRLRPEEIDCRIAQIKKNENGAPKGLSLLLYKDARCDQNILDETVGPMNWKREHTRDNRNCIVSLWDAEKSQWISKEDTGTESNTEREKGLASDSFKRACFNWGIGRELYSAPFIWIDAKDCNIKIDKNGRAQCYDRFTLVGIGYNKDGTISGVKVKNQNTHKVCFDWGTIDENAPEKPEATDDEPDELIKTDVADQFQQNKSNVTVEASDKVPQKKCNPAVKKYIDSQLTLMKEIYGIMDDKEVINKFVSMRKGLIEGGVIQDVKSEDQTMEDAINMFEAIYANFKPSGDRK